MKKPLIIVTGGCGYIGSHTLCELIEAGYDVISIDNISRSSENVLSFVEKITGRLVFNYNIDLCSASEVEQTFSQLEGVVGLIHFAAFKSVPESVASPESYYHNNIASLVNVLQACAKHTIRNVVFSSSCSVYGDIETLPVSESTPLSAPKSPYAATKVMGEIIVKDIAAAHGISAMCLRYFNPVGAHQSGMLGEMPLHTPDNLVPVITQTAIGKRPFMRVFGGDLPTRDGSCIRDYVHVSDIAQAHVLALQYLQQQPTQFDIVNLGTGSGVSVLEAIKTFETVSGQKLSYQVGPPREGDVVEIYSNVEKASTTLGWKPKRNLEDMMLSAWKWEQRLAMLQKEPSL
ncbi:MAG: UDP-glucose 4-epimerase GalE [Chitinophagaceae bacterium]|nr:MAG: UDP-glucose 4-epimerase GalE [Chitinophagaceae bacterium]